MSSGATRNDLDPDDRESPRSRSPAALPPGESGVPRPDYGEASYQGHGRLQGKVALITGGDSGIGREGADVLISYLNEDSDAEETARVVREAGRKAVVAPGDISEEAHCQSLIERTVSELGKLDILVNNAAYQMTRDGIAQIPDGEWEHTFKTKVSCPQYCPSPTVAVDGLGPHSTGCGPGRALIHRPAISVHKIPCSPHTELAGVARVRSRFPLEPPVILGCTTEG